MRTAVVGARLAVMEPITISLIVAALVAKAAELAAERAGADIESVRQSIRGDHNIQIGGAGRDVYIARDSGK